MTSIATRAFCAVMSVVGAAGLVAFVDPANGVGAGARSPTAAVVVAASMAAAHRG